MIAKAAIVQQARQIVADFIQHGQRAAVRKGGERIALGEKAPFEETTAASTSPRM